MEKITPFKGCLAELRTVEEYSPGRMSSGERISKISVRLSCVCGADSEFFTNVNTKSIAVNKNETLQEARNHKKSPEHLENHCRDPFKFS